MRSSAAPTRRPRSSALRHRASTATARRAPPRGPGPLRSGRVARADSRAPRASRAHAAPMPRLAAVTSATGAPSRASRAGRSPKRRRRNSIVSADAEAGRPGRPAALLLLEVGDAGDVEVRPRDALRDELLEEHAGVDRAGGAPAGVLHVGPLGLQVLAVLVPERAAARPARPPPRPPRRARGRARRRASSGPRTRCRARSATAPVRVA